MIDRSDGNEAGIIVIHAKPRGDERIVMWEMFVNNVERRICSSMFWRHGDEADCDRSPE